MRDSVLTAQLEHATVAEAMHPGIVSCPPEATPASVAGMMVTHNVHCVFVMHAGYDDPEKSYVWGIISDLDLMRAALRGDENETAGSLAAEPMVSVKPEVPLNEACDLMLKHHVSHLVVIDPTTLRPTGVLSTTDVAELLAQDEA